MLYATDAQDDEVEPIGVVVPVDNADACAAVRVSMLNMACRSRAAEARRWRGRR
ncbi:MAG: hypothetical protein U0575_02755 [Phycisphaerales bacterium]